MWKFVFCINQACSFRYGLEADDEVVETVAGRIALLPHSSLTLYPSPASKVKHFVHMIWDPPNSNTQKPFRPLTELTLLKDFPALSDRVDCLPYIPCHEEASVECQFTYFLDKYSKLVSTLKRTINLRNIFFMDLNIILSNV